MNAIVLAYHNMGCAGIEALLRNKISIDAVFTYPDDPNEGSWFRSVAELASRNNIPVYSPKNINSPVWIEKIRQLNPDYLFSFYYRDIVSASLLQIPNKGSFNLHGSLLPKYRGRAPINWAIIAGEKDTGVTLHHMTQSPDAGDIVCQQSVAIEQQDTAYTLYEKMVIAAGEMLNAWLPKIVSGDVPRTPQDNTKASYFGKRGPDDGLIDWQQSSDEIHNLVRAVTKPYPGAFTFRGQQKTLIWQTISHINEDTKNNAPGAVISIKPLKIACGKGVIEVCYAQIPNDLYLSGSQFADATNLVPGIRFSGKVSSQLSRKTKVLILGVNGFIGNALTERLLQTGEYEVHGMDLNDNAIQRFRDEPDFHFHEGDIAIHREWIEYHVKKCDVILPLIAIATPIEYTRNPIRVFELDFEENLRIVRYCVKYGKRIIFPSTSEVYGMCDEPEFNEDSSRLILGPINKQRWIYSASKQLLDRVIFAYGKSQGLDFTLFRPFNWIGPRLDSLDSARIGSSRAITQLILNLVEGSPIQLIDGGSQKRCFTDVSEGVECLYRIIENPNGVCNGAIINIGNPNNEASIKELAETLLQKFDAHPMRKNFPPFAGMHITESRAYYGEGYQDVQHRKPSIKNANRLLNWHPKIPLADSVSETLDFFLESYAAEKGLTKEK